MFVVCCCPDSVMDLNMNLLPTRRIYLFLLFLKHIFLWNKNFFCIGEYETIDTIKLRMSRSINKSQYVSQKFIQISSF